MIICLCYLTRPTSSTVCGSAAHGADGNLQNGASPRNWSRVPLFLGGEPGGSLQTLKIEDTDQDRLQIYTKALIRKLEQAIRDKDKEFTGISLQNRMLAEAFAEDFVSFYLLDKSHPEFQHKLDLLGHREQIYSGKGQAGWCSG